MKKMIRMVLIMSLLTFLLGCSGCSRQQDSTEGKIKFSTFSQEERKGYVNEYLKDVYDFNYTISEVKKKQISVVSSQDFYFARVEIEDGETFNVWISNDGAIIDSYFMLEKAPIVSEYFSDKVTNVFLNCRVRTRTVLLDVPSTKLLSADNVETFLRAENTLSYVYVFVEDEENDIEENITKLKAELKGCDVMLYMYIGEDLDTIDVDSYDLSTYDYFELIGKEK